MRTVGIIGAGLMGSGIAMCFLRAGYSVVLVETKQARRALLLTTLTALSVLTPCSLLPTPYHRPLTTYLLAYSFTSSRTRYCSSTYPLPTHHLLTV